MTRSVLVGCIGLVLSIVPAKAGGAKDEVDFVTRAAIGDLFAVMEGRLAVDRAGTPALKAFAQRMVADHGAAATALRAAAQGSGAEPPETLDDDHRARLAALQGSVGTAFDRAYAADQVEMHSNALTLYADYMLLGGDAPLKALAIRMIPIAEAELRDAKALTGD